MEGRSIDYFPAVVNAYGVDGFSITGKGTIDGNGLKYWEAFWQRRAENPKCTNLEVSRPRLVFIQNSKNVQLQDVKLHNSGFWTTHLYRCSNVKLLNLHIFSPAAPVKAPSTDAIDIDACTNVLVNGCYMEVNDDAIALKGGKGVSADTDPTNGPNQNIIIQNCTFGFCHSAVTCGSESIHNRNIIMRNCKVNGPSRVFWLKNRGDTPQLYEYILVENITGKADRLLFAKPWTQFFDLQGRDKPLLSTSNQVVFRNIELTCQIFADIEISEYDKLKNFTFENLKITAEKGELNKSLIEGLTLKNVVVNGKLIE
jgi:polygalacturonase